jgi:glycosyltransferase involved in cell wall biosynthesis
MNTVAIYRVKDEARWIGESLERTLGVADGAIVLDDRSSDSTVEIAAAFSRVEVVKTPFTTFDEARDKSFLLRMAFARHARWIICLDGDEVFTPSAVVEARDIIKLGAGGVYFFRMAYLWDAPDQERCDGIYAKIECPRLFSIFDQRYASAEEISYRGTDHGGNMHCGSIPERYKSRRRNATAAIKHYGYMHAADRARKHAWYNESDLEGGRLREGNYDHILGKPNKWAPGPVELRPFADK